MAGALLLSFLLGAVSLRAQAPGDAGGEATATAGDETSLLERVPLVERFGDYAEDLAAAGVRAGLEPIGPRSGPGLTVTFDRYEPLVLETGISLRGSQFHRAGVELGRPGLGGRLSVSFRRDAEDEFRGLRIDPSRPVAASDFLRDKKAVALAGWLRVRPRLLLRGGVAYENNRVGRGWDGGLPDVQTVYASHELPGMRERTELLRLDLSARADLVRRTGFRRAGVRLRLGGSLFADVGGTGAGFHRLRAEARAYRPLGEVHMLALRALVEVNRPRGSSAVPFYELARLGGGDTGPRGLSGGRFRGRDGLSVMAEWRFEVWRDGAEEERVQGVVFLDRGGVTRNLARLRTSRLRGSAGLGVRLMDRRDPGRTTFGYVAFSGSDVQLGVRTGWGF